MYMTGRIDLARAEFPHARVCRDSAHILDQNFANTWIGLGQDRMNWDGSDQIEMARTYSEWKMPM